MRGTVFYKMSGSGNDFVMLDGRYTRAEDWPPTRISEACDRRQGIGADGLAILTPEELGRVRMTFFNCDGSPAAMCGNAALCSTRLAAYLELADGAGMSLMTGAGAFPTRCVGDGWCAELNLPSFDLPRARSEIPRSEGESGIYFCQVGVPHLVVLVSDVEGIDLPGRGRELRFHPALANGGANVNFVGITGPNPGAPWPIRTYERGVEGETLACGTGAVAAGVSLSLAGHDTLPTSFRTRSGLVLTVNAKPEPDKVRDVWLGGEGRLVFTGLI